MRFRDSFLSGPFCRTGNYSGRKEMSDRFVAILMGSDSDLPVVEGAFQVLKSLGICITHILTGTYHNSPCDKCNAFTTIKHFSQVVNCSIRI